MQAQSSGLDRVYRDCGDAFVHPGDGSLASAAVRNPGYRPCRVIGGGRESRDGQSRGCGHGAHPQSAAAHRASGAPTCPGVRPGAGRGIHDNSGGVCQCADGGADVRLTYRLRRGLHHVLETSHTAEHRHRRGRGRRAAGAGLDGGHGSRGSPLPVAVSDHLHLDAPAFLGACDSPAAGIRAGGDSDAPCYSRCGIHAPAYLAVYDYIDRRERPALCDAHERGVLSRGGPGVGCGLFVLCSSAAQVR